MAKYEAAPRFNAGVRQPLITFDNEKGLVLSGWFVEHTDMENVKPTEREMVAAIFRYILDTYTERVPMELSDEFKKLEPWNYCWEIPIGVEMGFDRN